LDLQRFQQLYDPLLGEIEAHSSVADAFIDKDVYRVHIALFWANVALAPEQFGVREDELAELHTLLNEAIARVLGAGSDVRSCFEFVISAQGDACLGRARANQQQRNLLYYVASLILNPEGHADWIAAQREDV
jgi:hypothetical protein